MHVAVPVYVDADVAVFVHAHQDHQALSQALTPVWRTYLYMYVYLYFCTQKGPSTHIAQMYHNSDL